MSFISVLSQNVIRSFAVWVDQDTFMYQFHTMIILILFCITQALYETKLVGFYVHFFPIWSASDPGHIYLWSRIPRNEERLMFSP